MKYFGTDGFRGQAGVTLTSEHAYKIGRYLGWYYGRNGRGRIAIGKDTRRSSYTLEYGLVTGITASGSDVYIMHVTTTPSVAYVVRTEDFDCGIMVSASHNPYYDNGIKIIDGNGHKISSNIEENIEKYIDGEIGELPFATGEDMGMAKDHAIGRNRYIGYLISLATRSYNGMRVGIDASNGSGFAIAKSVFDALGAKTYVIANDPDGLNINKDCGSTHIENLVSLVKEKELDCGFALDGDADRCIAVDENGNIIDGDFMLYICGGYLKRHNKLDKNHIVATVMSNLGLFRALDKLGIEYEMTGVGDKYVNDNMVKNDYVLGGEQSGHVIFSRYATTGDGILTAIMLMEVITEEKKSLGALASGMKKYPQRLKNISVVSKSNVMENEKVRALADEIDRELSHEGRLLLRESGTEPLIRIMVEAESLELCDKCVKRIADLIYSEGLDR